MIDKVLFLDIDGVLNCGQDFDNEAAKTPSGIVLVKNINYLSPEHVSRLNKIVNETKCEVVINSTWRTSHTFAVMEHMLSEAGYTGSILSVTPSLDHRSQAIKTWLASHPTKCFAIVDDSLIDDDLQDRFVKTNFEDGLQDIHVEKVIALLSN